MMDILRQSALLKISKALQKAKRPAVLWSGGKDSTVLLHLARSIRKDIEVIHWKLPFLPQKYAHHHFVQEALGIIVHDWTPSRISLTHGNDRIDVCETYQVGSGDISVMRGTEPFEEGKPWVCGLEWLNRPTGTVNANFDVLLCGHKSSDLDPLSGVVPLNVDMKRLGSHTEMWFPIREWTDSDVAKYLHQNKVSFDTNRYDDAVVSKKDKHLNSDYVHACMRCVDKRERPFVRCPKLDADVENISKFVLHEQPSHDYCNLRTELSDMRGMLQPQVELANPEAGQVRCHSYPKGAAESGSSASQDIQQQVHCASR